jgi:uncharacterized metal-binding protein YceD (DUF177 family)
MDKIAAGGIEMTGGPGDSWVVEAVDSLRGIPGEPVTDAHALEPPEQASVVLRMRCSSDDVAVSGKTEIVFLRDCDRCGGTVRMSLSGTVRMRYHPPGAHLADSEHGLGEGDLDVGWHDGQAMDLSAVLTEQLALQAPDRVRCGEHGVVSVDGEGPCTLPDGVVAEEDHNASKRPNPFAGLKLSD